MLQIFFIKRKDAVLYELSQLCSKSGLQRFQSTAVCEHARAHRFEDSRRYCSNGLLLQSSGCDVVGFYYYILLHIVQVVSFYNYIKNQAVMI